MRERERRRRTSTGARTVRFVRDDRSVSVQINYTLSLAIITVMIAGLFMAMSSFIDNERESAVQSEFDVLGNRIAADIAVADRLNQSATADATVRVTTRVPAEVAGTSYRVTVVRTPVGSRYYDVTVYLASEAFEVNRSVSVRTQSRIEPGTFSGNDYVIVYDQADQRLEVRNGD